MVKAKRSEEKVVTVEDRELIRESLAELTRGLMKKYNFSPEKAWQIIEEILTVTI